MTPRYISRELFHFFGRPAPLDHERNYAMLKLVLANGCISHPPHEIGWGTIAYTLDISKRLAREEMLVPTVTCYCDIPFDLLGPHTTKYGYFGLSFSRHFLTKVGARPVIYVPCRPDDWMGVFTGKTLLQELEATFLGVREQLEALGGNEEGQHLSIGLGTRPKTAEEALKKANHALALRIFAFIKPYDSTLDEADPRYYYSEREWRKLGNLPFVEADVNRVVVEDQYLEQARDELPEYADRLHSLPR